MLRILHGPANVGNQPWILSRHERILGARSNLVVNYNTWLNYPVDCCLSEYQNKTTCTILRRAWFALTAPFLYDVLHFYFGRSFFCWDDYGPPNHFWYADLKLAKRLGKKVFMTFQGCDARQSDLSEARNEITMCREGFCQSRPVCRAQLDSQRREVISRIVPLADRVFVLNPELVHHVPQAVFMPYASVDIESFSPVWPKTEGPITILHAPSNQGIKGTPMIINAVNRLKQRWPIEFILVENMTYDKAIQLYQQADLVIDQTLSGWYGGVAVEAMAMGKPVACYLREQDFDCLPGAMRAELPLLNLTPATIETDLESIIKRRAEWPEWGRRARDYVLRWHNPSIIADAMLKAYQDPLSKFCLSVE